MSYQSSHTGANIDKGVSLALAMYPVGSIYLSVNNVNPGTIFGGSWEQIQDRFLLAAGSTYTGGSTGGVASHTHTSAAHTHTSAAHTHTTAGHTLTINEIPSHTHHFWVNIQHSDGTTTTGESLKSGLQVNGRRRYTDYTDATGGGASHSHGNTGSTTPEATGSTTPGNTGSSSNLPPYLAIYVFKRTA